MWVFWKLAGTLIQDTKTDSTKLQQNRRWNIPTKIQVKIERKSKFDHFLVKIQKLEKLTDATVK